jgi:hypothetical protein
MILKLGIARSALQSRPSLSLRAIRKRLLQAHTPCVPQNRHATANTAVPRWHLDVHNGHTACHCSTNE